MECALDEPETTTIIDEPRRSWRELWQVPTLVLAVVLLVAGLVGVVMSSPDPDIAGMLGQAEKQLAKGEYREALATLNDKVRQYTDAPFFTKEHRQQFHLLRGRAIGRGQRDLGLEEQANYETVLDELFKAERLHAKLSHDDRVLITEALIETDQFDKALKRVQAMDDSAASDRIRLRKALISRALSRPIPRIELAETLLTELAQDPMLDVNDRCWTAARRAELQLDRGYIEEAITGLLREMPRVSTAEPRARGELMTLLGRGYLESGAVSEAKVQLGRAADLIPPGDELYAETLFQLGKSLEQSDEYEKALEKFEEIARDYAGSPTYLPSLLAIGGVRSAIAAIDPAIVSKEEAVAAYVRFADEAEGRADQALLVEAANELLRRSEESFVQGELLFAAQYVQLAEDLFGIDEAPDDVLLAQAKVNLALADELVEGVKQDGTGITDMADADPVTRAQAQRYFVRAADYFRRHADRLAGGDNDAGYASSLWNAADAFDRGGDSTEAIAGFSEFASTISDDPRVPEAQYRLARAYQAAGEYDLAAQQYEAILEAANNAAQSRGVGPYAVMSYVPLAQCYLEDADPSNDERAETLLNSVIRGDIGDVDSEAFAEALASLGQVHYLKGEYPRAIESLTEAVARNADGRGTHRLRFLLADSLRLEADRIRQTLDAGSVSPSVARELRTELKNHLREAITLFTQVRDGLEQIDQRRLSSLEKLYLRNSYFYIGDCEFDLGEYDAAIRAYSIAKDRFSEQASSLVAMVQIFNAYVQLGDLERARTASERAKRFYEALPDEAWDDQTLPMTQQDWQRWLDSSYELAAMQPDSVGG
ncbi:MAG TPA: tetratricopeptide repeat protein [Phycisphaerales bacterium]|nr:tetratricopeptide repeat protein [Phycisphaerales bacterium]